MATPSNRQTFIPPVHDGATPQQLHNHVLAFTSLNDHDAAITALAGQFQALISNLGYKVSGSSVTPTSSNAVSASSSSNPVTASQASSIAATAARNAIASTFSNVNVQSAATYTVQGSDYASLVNATNASGAAVSLNSAVNSGFFTSIQSSGNSPVTLTPTSGTINGASSFTIPAGQGVSAYFDGTNWHTSGTALVAPTTITAPPGNALIAYNASTGAFTASPIDFSDISGTIAPSQLPTPTPSTLGGIESIAPVTSQWVSSIDNSGAPHLSQPDFTDISGTASAAQLPVATTSTVGAVQPDGTTITISGGVISAVLPTGATGTVTLAALTTGGTQGSLTITNGIVTSIVDPT